MKAGEVYEWFGNHTSADYTVEVEAGGDGAIQGGVIRSVRVDHDTKTVTLSTEED